MNSPVYYNEHLQAMFNLVDSVDDKQLRTLATMVLDLLVFNVVRRVLAVDHVHWRSRGDRRPVTPA